MTIKQKLDLAWIGKDKRPQLEPRILLEDAAKSYHVTQRMSVRGTFDYCRILRDNLMNEPQNLPCPPVAAGSFLICEWRLQ
jgi:adenine-specific DNA-methyltransferase